MKNNAFGKRKVVVKEVIKDVPREIPTPLSDSIGNILLSTFLNIVNGSIRFINNISNFRTLILLGVVFTGGLDAILVSMNFHELYYGMGTLSLLMAFVYLYTEFLVVRTIFTSFPYKPTKEPRKGRMDSSEFKRKLKSFERTETIKRRFHYFKWFVVKLVSATILIVFLMPTLWQMSYGKLTSMMGTSVTVLSSNTERISVIEMEIAGLKDDITTEEKNREFYESLGDHPTKVKESTAKIKEMRKQIGQKTEEKLSMKTVDKTAGLMTKSIYDTYKQFSHLKGGISLEEYVSYINALLASSLVFFYFLFVYVYVSLKPEDSENVFEIKTI